MSERKKIEVFTANCPVCEDLLSDVRSQVRNCCELEVLDMSRPEVAARAKALGVRSVPALFIDGKPATSCC